MSGQILYPIWNFARIEAILEELERKGFRVEKVSFRYFFNFRECAPKDVRYLLSDTYGKDCEIQNYEYDLRRYWGANGVPVRNSLKLKLYRITDPAADVSEFLQFRNIYLRRAMVHRMLLSMLFLTCFGVMWAAGGGTLALLLLAVTGAVFGTGAFGWLFLWKHKDIT